MQVEEEEGLVPSVVECLAAFAEAREVDGSAKATAENVLDELPSRRAVNVVVVLVRDEARCLVELEEVAMKVVRPGAGYNVTCAPLLRPNSAVKLPVTT